nr:glycosyltransferase family 2 protein [Cognatishimia maritima]
MSALSLSVVIPAKNEAKNLPSLIEGINAACAGMAFEVIVVDDGSDDDSVSVLRTLAENMPHLRVVAHDRSAGQSAAVHSGVLAAKSNVICTLDGDGQNPPSELPKLFGPILKNDGTGRLGLVAGQRVNRQDTASKKLASKFANRLRSWILKDATRDTGCGLKAFRKDGFLELPYFDHMHRYLPALFARAGWEIAHVDVTHKAREAGVSKYNNLNRALVGITDLMGVAWLLKRAKKSTASEIDLGH